MARYRSFILGVALLASAFVAVVNYRSRPPALPVAAEASVVAPLPDEVSIVAPDLRPARPDEVAAAVLRVFQGAVPREALRAHRAVTGDFNGDGSPDLAVPARATRQLLPAINGRFANWIIQDPLVPSPEGPAPDVTRVRIVIGGDDALLAVVHGYDAAGWRHPESRQGYLLRAGLDGPVEIRPWRTLVHTRARLPYLRGDLICETQQHRFLYWTGARYLWHGLRSS